MSRAAVPASSEDYDTDTIPVDTRSTWRREQDRALKLRLEQLKIAQIRTPIPAIAAALAHTARPAQQSAPTLASRASDRGHGIRTLLAVALFGALAGAVLMWMTINGVARQTRPLPTTGAVSFTPATVATAAIPTPEPTAAKPEPKPAVQVDTSDSQARELIEGWRQAWASRDATAYLTHYSQSFTPANGQQHANWAEGRQRNFASKSSIQVAVKDLRIERLSDDRIKAFFRQDYASGNYRENAQPKTLLLERTGQEWKISGEWEGDHALTAQAAQ